MPFPDAEVLHFARYVSTVDRWAVPIAPIQLVCVASSAINLLVAAIIHGAAARNLMRKRLLVKKVLTKDASAPFVGMCKKEMV